MIADRFNLHVSFSFTPSRVGSVVQALNQFVKSPADAQSINENLFEIHFVTDEIRRELSIKDLCHLSTI